MNAIRVYRVGNALYRWKVPLLPRLLRVSVFLIYNSDIPFSCRIGTGSWFAHGGVGVVLNRDCVIGERVCIGQSVTIGGSFGSAVPTIGNDVWIGPGARILGGIRVGNNVVIGANAVVLHDVDDNSVVAGVPARLLRRLAAGAVDTANGRFRD